ncbi:hypothetical protein ABIB26_001445 [Arthrobacter sp. UYEF20]
MSPDIWAAIITTVRMLVASIPKSAHPAQSILVPPASAVPPALNAPSPYSAIVHVLSLSMARGGSATDRICPYSRRLSAHAQEPNANFRTDPPQTPGPLLIHTLLIHIGLHAPDLRCAYG